MLTDPQRKAELQRQHDAAYVERWLVSSGLPTPCACCGKQVHWKEVCWSAWTGGMRSYCQACYAAPETGSQMRERFSASAAKGPVR